MGTAILKGLLNTTATRGDSNPSITYTAWVRSQTSLERLQRALGEDGKQQVNCLYGGDVIASTITPADVVVLGFPPGELKAAFRTPGMADALRGKLIISLLAGVTYDQLEGALLDPYNRQAEPPPPPSEEDYHILRAIPSIGAQINDSVTLLAEAILLADTTLLAGTTTFATPSHRAVTTWLFNQIGQTYWLPESLMNEATAMTAACNALTIIAVDSIVDASVAEGIPRPAAMKLAAASMRSSAGMLLPSTSGGGGGGGGGMTPESLKEAMSVPRGITINSVLELERGHVRSAVSDAVRQAIRYTRNMSG